MVRQVCICRQDAHFLLLCKHLLAIGIPTGVKLALVFVGPFLWNMMRRMHGAGTKIHKERLVGRNLLGIGDHCLGLADEIGRQVVALLRRLFRLGLAVVTDKFRVVLVRISTKKPVITLKATA